jgi:hypothetical protein
LNNIEEFFLQVKFKILEHNAWNRCIIENSNLWQFSWTDFFKHAQHVQHVQYVSWISNSLIFFRKLSSSVCFNWKLNIHVILPKNWSYEGKRPPIFKNIFLNDFSVTKLIKNVPNLILKTSKSPQKKFGFGTFANFSLANSTFANQHLPTSTFAN